jgi:DNA-directed RNA polymerase specialized sigma24 family protein
MVNRTDTRMAVDSQREEFERLVLPILDRVRRALIVKYGVETGSDVAADAMEWAWQHMDRVVSMENPAGYLFRVGQSAARQHQRWWHSTTTFPNGGRWLAADVLVMNDDMMDALRRLTPSQRVSVLMVHGYGFSYRDVADVLGIRESAVTNHIHRGLSRLRRILEQT